MDTQYLFEPHGMECGLDRSLQKAPGVDELLLKFVERASASYCPQLPPQCSIKTGRGERDSSRTLTPLSLTPRAAITLSLAIVAVESGQVPGPEVGK